MNRGANQCWNWAKRYNYLFISGIFTTFSPKHNEVIAVKFSFQSCLFSLCIFAQYKFKMLSGCRGERQVVDRKLQNIKEYHRTLHIITEYYRISQNIKEYHRMSHISNITEYYRILQIPNVVRLTRRTTSC